MGGEGRGERAGGRGLSGFPYRLTFRGHLPVQIVRRTTPVGSSLPRGHRVHRHQAVTPPHTHHTHGHTVTRSHTVTHTRSHTHSDVSIIHSRHPSAGDGDGRGQGRGGVGTASAAAVSAASAAEVSAAAAKERTGTHSKTWQLCIASASIRISIK